MFDRIDSGISVLVFLFGLMSSVNGVVSIPQKEHFLFDSHFVPNQNESHISLQRVNITSFKTCDMDPSENLEHFVRFTDISLECNADGFCDIVHAKFHIPTVNDGDKLVEYE